MAVETWHDSSKCPSVIASTPTGYSCIEKACQRGDDGLTTNHGGICILYKSNFFVREIQLPKLKTTEVLAIHIQSPAMRMTVIVLYHPGSSPVNMDFLEKFSDILERMNVFAAPLIIAGDVNIHLDVPSIYSMRFKEILLDFDLVQHASGPTHVAGHTLDMMITHRSLDDATAVSVEPPVISDHSLISCQITTKHVEQCQHIILKRKWKKFDINMFRQDLQELELIVNPPPDNNDLVQSYNRVLKELLDKHATPSSTKV